MNSSHSPHLVHLEATSASFGEKEEEESTTPLEGRVADFVQDGAGVDALTVGAAGAGVGAGVGAGAGRMRKST